MKPNATASFFRIALLAFLLSAISHPPSAFPQGSLTPPGAPGATMKTLQQIEPRTDLQAPTLPPGVTTDANSHFIIGQAGSYYLSANLGATKTNGIRINAEGVTVDLNGFEISRASGSGGNGIRIEGTSHRASIRNGSIKGFDVGLNALFATKACAVRDVSASGCTSAGISVGAGAVLESCRAHDNSGVGISASFGSTLTNCSAYANTATYGIYASAGSTLTNCSASANTATYGIYASDGSTLINCSASGNTAAWGISASDGSTLINCSAYNNQSATANSAGITTSSGCTINHCSARANLSTAASTPTTGMGFNVGTGSTITNCTASRNGGNGIRVSNSCLVFGNNSDENGDATGDGAGIHATGTENRIDGNKVSNNDRGIDVDGDRNFIVRNTARENLTGAVGMNYVIVTGNRVGVIVIPNLSGDIAGDSDPDAVGVNTTDPWANFTY